MKHYVKFGLMISVSTLLMLGLMYLNVFKFDHIYLSQTRIYMALLMGSVMAIVMLTFMQEMYTMKHINFAIYAGSLLVFAFSLWLVRSQSTIDDVAWMKAMIPHHSIAILTSTRADLTNPKVKKLADGIVESQTREISEMKALIEELEHNQ